MVATQIANPPAQLSHGLCRHAVLVWETKKVAPLCIRANRYQQMGLAAAPVPKRECLARFLLLPVTRESCRDLNAAPLVAVAS